MTPDTSIQLLDSMTLVGRGLAVLERAALRAGRGPEMAKLEMRLVILKVRLQAGGRGAGLLSAVRLFIDDFEAFVSLCFK